MIKTLEQLKEEWGMERYVKAFGDMTGWILEYYPNQSVEDLKRFQDENPDAFTCFESYLMYEMAQGVA